MNNKGFIKSIIAITIVLGVVFLSQQPYFRSFGRQVYQKAREWAGPYQAQFSAWLSSHVYPRIGGEVAKREEIFKEEFNQQKKSAVQSVWESIRNFFAEKFSDIFNTPLE